MVSDRVKLRRPELDDTMIAELQQSATSRILLRVGGDTLPPALESTCVEIVLAMANRLYHEGIASESVDSLSTAFIDDIVLAYQDDFDLYLAAQKRAENPNAGKLQFL